MVQDPKTSVGIYALGSNDIRGLLEQFLLDRQADRRSPFTLRWYRSEVGRFVRWLVEHGHPTDIREITPAHIRLWRVYLAGERRWDGRGRAGQPLADSSHASYDRAIRTFFRWAVRDVEAIDTSPLERLKRPSVARKPMRFLSGDELERIWATLPSNTRQGQRDRTLFMLLLDTGLRRAEVLGIDHRALDVQGRRVLVRGKGGHVRYVGLSVTTIQQIDRYVRRWRQHCDQVQLLLHASKARPLTYGGLKPILQRWQRDAGIIEPFSPHSFRRTTATRAIDSGADPVTVAAQLGHNSLKMVQHYAQVAGIDLGEMQAKHSPLKGLKLK